MDSQIISKEEAIDIIIDLLYDCDIEELQEILKEYFDINDYEIKED